MDCQNWTSIIDEIILITTGPFVSFFRKPGPYIEENPILGPHPGRHAINDYFAVCAAGHLAIAIALPHDQGRRLFQVATIGLEAWTAHRNAGLGLRITC